MKAVASISLVFSLVLVVLPIERVRADDSADLAKLQPLSPEESELYETAKNDPVALHKLISSRTYFRKIDQLCSDAPKKCCDIAPTLPDDVDSDYAVDFDEQVSYLQLLVCREMRKDKK